MTEASAGNNGGERALRARRLAIVAVAALSLAVIAFFALRFAMRPVPDDAGTRSHPRSSLAHVETPRGEPVRISEPGENERTAADAPNFAASDPSAIGDGLLVVHVLEQETERPRADVNVSLRRAGDDPTSVIRGVGAHGKIHDGLRTAADGVVEFVAPAGTALVVTVWSDDGSTSPAPTELAPFAAREHREITLHVSKQDDRMLFGRVVARATKEPLSGARITRGKQELARTDPDGHFSVTWAAWNANALAASSEGYAASWFLPVESADSRATELNIELERGAALIVSLAGIPEDGSSKFALEATASVVVEARLGEEWHALVTTQHWTAEFDEHGRAVLENLPPGVDLVVRAMQARVPAHVEPAAIVLSPGERRELEWKLGAGCRVRVSVTEGGMPVPDVSLWLIRDTGFGIFVRATDNRDVVQRAKSDANGQATFSDLAPGSWRIAPAPPKNSPLGADSTAIASVCVPFRVGPEETRRAIELVVQRGLYITGRVFDTAGRLVHDGRVTAVLQGFSSIDASVEADGSFVVGPLVEGEYSIGAESGTDLPSERLAVRAGATDVELRLRTAAVLSGQVVDAASGMGCFGTCAIYPAGAECQKSWEVSAHSDGRFLVQGLDSRAYCVVATTTDGRVGMAVGAHVEVGTPNADLVVRVAPGGRVRIGYEGTAALGSVSVFVGEQFFACDGLVAKQPTTMLIPAGAARVEFTPTGAREAMRKDVMIVAGEEREVVFRD